MSNKISIVLPTYNQAQYLPAALDSVFAQTYQNYELVVVNDGSTDDTGAVLARYRLQHDFVIVDQENQGLPSALNAGFARASGEYLTWTSSDNIMLPKMLEILAEALDSDPTVGLVYADFCLIDDSDQNLGCFDTIDFDPHWLLYTNLVHCCFLYRQECMAEVGGYDPELVYSEDWDYWIRISKHYRMKRVPHMLYLYRLHNTSMTHDLQRGTSDSVEWSEFVARVRRRMPMRWCVHKVKWLLAYLTPMAHPALKERQAWLRAIA
jgi:glycosyltransferase involved in cell wall biosynthesis